MQMAVQRASSVVILLTLAGCAGTPGEPCSTQDARCCPAVEGVVRDASELALRWAPIHHQGTHVTGRYGLQGRADYLTAIDFDGDWDPTNNWANAETADATAHVYYSVVENHTHWFLVYAFYHPRDWVNWFPATLVDQHENDLEGLLLVVRKPSSLDEPRFGRAEAMVTVFHRDFYSYVPDRPGDAGYAAGEEDIDGLLHFEVWAGYPRPVTAQESRGHGLKAWPSLRPQGVRYVPSETGDIAERPASPTSQAVRYALVDIFGEGGLWARRHDRKLFAEFGVFRGDDFRNNAANAPWGWDDHNDNGALGKGALACNPIQLIDAYFDNLGPFSTTYGTLADAPYGTATDKD